MSQVWLLALRGLFGGLLVTAFALLGEMVSPKRFAGIFAAGPAVALAGMSITVLHAGSRPLADSALGMIVGSAALVVYCALAVPLVGRLGAVAGSAAAVGVWLAVAGLGWWLMP
ncbi:hypothetical protein Ssi03_58640 [Sphaerisporangium siamense]|uniref:Putative membrane protein n=1 Tax=Sphaerisporangium siamense TaxID=795645 RepID=A0A7W7D5I9_9ACTN|nr:DUF3147 family protein [Sphaerisporangium siamense]MBB4699695.1 putative membrane protein [Sphaerisporangium siamense]GII87874.1 hypothetical protein Ssi03_58640 [Sphaerisporangium siamense]